MCIFAASIVGTSFTRFEPTWWINLFAEIAIRRFLHFDATVAGTEHLEAVAAGARRATRDRMFRQIRQLQLGPDVSDLGQVHSEHAAVLEQVQTEGFLRNLL